MIEQINPTSTGSSMSGIFQIQSKVRLVRIVLFIVLLTPVLANAQEKNVETKGSGEHRYQGEFTINLHGHTVTDSRTGSTLPISEIKVRWATWVMMGQPVKTFVSNFSLQNGGFITTSGIATCSQGEVSIQNNLQTFRLQTTETEKVPPGEILSTSVFRAWFISADPKRPTLSPLLNKNHKVFIDFKPDSMVASSFGFGISAPGSPDWNQFFQRSSFGGSVFLTEEEAKEVMRRGLKIERIELIKPHLSVSTALAQHNRQVRIDCEEERKAKTNVQPDDKSPSLTDKLNARLVTEQTKSESSAANENAEASDKLTSLTDRLNARLSGEQTKTDSSAGKENSQSSDKLASLTDRLNARLDDARAKSDTSAVSDAGEVGKLQSEGKSSKQGKEDGLRSFCTKREIYNSVTRFTSYENDKCGYKDHAGNVVIQPQFDGAREFHFGYAVVEKGYRTYYLIDTTGKTVLGRPFHGMHDLGEFGLLAVQKDSRAKEWSYVDLNGNTVIDTHYVEAYSFVNGLARVVDRISNKSTTYINREFESVAGQFYNGRDFSRGLAVVKTAELSYDGYEEYRFLKKDGSLMGSYANAHSFHESGFAAVARIKDNNLAWGIIDTQGKVIVPLDYRGAHVTYSETGAIEFEVEIDIIHGERYIQRFNTQGKAVSGSERRNY